MGSVTAVSAPDPRSITMTPTVPHSLVRSLLCRMVRAGRLFMGEAGCENGGEVGFPTSMISFVGKLLNHTPECQILTVS